MSRTTFYRIAGAAGVVAFWLLVFRNYYGPDGLLFEDANLPWTRELLNAAWVQFLHAWNPHFGGGMSSIIQNATTFAPLLAQTSLSFLGIPLSTALVYPAFSLLGSCGAYFLSRELGANRLGAIVLGLFYVGNPWFIDRMISGHTAILTAVALLPWLFWAVERQRRGAHAYGLLLVAIAAADLQADVRIAYFAFVGVYLVVCARLITAAVRGGRTELMSVARLPGTLYPVVAPFAAFALSAWWTVPFLMYKDINPVPAFYPPLEEIAGFSQFGDLVHAFALSGFWIRLSWTTMAGFGAIPFGIWYASFAMLMVAALFAPGVSASRRVLVALAIVGGVLFSTGTSYVPRESVYWLYEHVPYAAFFRDPNKFGFVVVFGLLVGISSGWARLDRRLQMLIAGATIVICIPLFLGRFQAPRGAGFQSFWERPHFVKVLSFLRAQPGFPTFRIAVLPPFLAEQSLRLGAWYVANPFVFQHDVPTIDAQNVSTGTPTNQSAWRAFNGLYWGTDRHPARTFARLAIRYFVVLDDAVVSMGAGYSAFYGAQPGPVKAALLADPQIHEIYRDGSYHIYANDAYVPPLRTAALPLIGGSLSEEVRMALPADEFGDSVTSPGGRPGALPRGTIAFGENGLERCLGTRADMTSFTAYADVPARSDWYQIWSASDYPQGGTSDLALDRRLQRFALPFAVSKSGHPFSIPFTAPAGEHVFVQAAGFTEQTMAQASIDSGPPVSWTPSSLGFSWREVGVVTAGPHVLTFIGSTIGSAIKAVAVAPGPCGAGGIGLARGGGGSGRVYFVPGAIEWTTVAREGSRWTATSAGTPMTVDGRVRIVNQSAANGPLPSGVRGMAWDGVPLRDGVPFATLRGTHTLAGFSAEGPNLAGALQPNVAGFESQARGFVLGDTAVIDLASRSAAPARVAIDDGDRGERGTELNLPGRGSATVLFQPVAPEGEVRVTVSGLPRTAGPATFTVAVRRGLERFRATVDLPASGVRLPDDAKVAIQPTVARSVAMRLEPDGASLEMASATPSQLYFDCRQGTLAHVRIAGARANALEREVLTAYYRTQLGDEVTLPAAEFDAGPIARNVDLTVPATPYMTSFALAIRRPDHTSGSLRFTSSELTAGPRVDPGYLVRIPASIVARRARAVDLAANSYERFSVARPFAGPLVGGFSYDENWTYRDAPRFIANGTSNLWVTDNAGSGAYALQPLYLRLLAACAFTWLVLAGAIVALFVRRRVRRSIGSSGESGGTRR